MRRLDSGARRRRRSASTREHPLIKFKLHALQTNEILLLVADLVAAMLVAAVARADDRAGAGGGDDDDDDAPAARRSRRTRARAAAPLRCFTNVPWWECAVAPEGGGGGDPARFAATLRAICDDARRAAGRGARAPRAARRGAIGVL